MLKMLEDTKEPGVIRTFKEAGISDEKAFKLVNAMKRLNPGMYHRCFGGITEVPGAATAVREMPREAVLALKNIAK